MKKSIELLNNLNIDKKTPLIIGCSGGPDSMCLLHFLHQNGYQVICVHINHNIRRVSKNEYNFVKEYCEKMQIPFEGKTLEKEKQNEAYYRNKRYEFYKNIAKKYDTKYILTAHHGDDLIETILMRLSRGSYLKGYAGFEKFYEEDNLIYIKPLIYYTKQDIIKYNQENNIKYVIDSSNEENTYTRNKYRHLILPPLKSINKNIHLKYLQYSELINETESFIDSLIEKSIEENFHENILDLNKFLKLDKYLQKREIERILKKIYKNDVDKLQVFHIDSILFLLAKEKNASIDLPLGLKVIREYNNLIFTYCQTHDKYCIEFEQYIKLPNGDEIIKIEKSEDTSNNTIFLNSKDIQLPLYVRNKKTNDKIQIKNMQGSKSIKSLFIDEKISPSKRNSYPLLVDSNDNILWVPGLRKSKFDNKNGQKCDIILKYIKKGDKVNEN